MSQDREWHEVVGEKRQRFEGAAGRKPWWEYTHNPEPGNPQDFKVVQTESVAHVDLGFSVDHYRMREGMGDAIQWGDNAMIPTVVRYIDPHDGSAVLCRHQITASGKIIARGDTIEQIVNSFVKMVPIYHRYRDYIFKVTLNQGVNINALETHIENMQDETSKMYRVQSMSGVKTYKGKWIQHQFTTAAGTAILAHGPSEAYVRETLVEMLPIYAAFAKAGGGLQIKKFEPHTV